MTNNPHTTIAIQRAGLERAIERFVTCSDTQLVRQHQGVSCDDCEGAGADRP